MTENRLKSGVQLLNWKQWQGARSLSCLYEPSGRRRWIAFTYYIILFSWWFLLLTSTCSKLTANVLRFWWIYVYETPGFSLRYFCYAIYVYYKKWSLLSNNRKRSLFLHSLEIWWLWSIIFTTSISIWVCLWLHASMHSFVFMFIHSLLLLGADTLRLWSDIEIVFQYRVSLEFTNKIATTHLPVVKII